MAYWTINRGNYWLSSNRGLIRYEPQNKRAQLYTIEDGLQSNQFNFRSSLQASDGNSISVG